MEDAKQIPFNLSPFLEFDTRLLKGWNTDFIIAGEFIHDVLSNITPQYIDFYVFTENGFHTLLDFLKIFMYKPNYSITTSYYIEINNKVRLFNAFNTEPMDIINNMEADLFACFYDGENIQQFPGCEDSIDALEVIHTFNPKKCNVTTILTAVNHGYKISREILATLGVLLDESDKPQNTLTMASTTEDFNEYENDVFQYLQVAVALTDDEYFALCTKDNAQHHDHSQASIKVYNLANAKQLLLPYILQHSIRKQIDQEENFNAGYGPPVDILHLSRPTMTNKETQLTFPPPPNRPLPVCPL